MEETTDCTDNITIILFSDMFSSFNISKEKSCSLNVQLLLFVFTTSFSRKNLRISPDLYLIVRPLYNSNSKQLLLFLRPVFFNGDRLCFL